MIRRARVVAALVVGLGLAAVAADGPRAGGSCEVPPFRGATRPGGAQLAVTLTNTGLACTIKNYMDPEQRTAPSELRLVLSPRNGVLVITQPDVVSYTPNAGFAGFDTFQYSGRGVGRDRRPLELSVTVSVTVLAGAEGTTKP